jgi:folate-binding protein YgfZ
MALTPLGDKLIQTGARGGEYCGVETAACFGDSRHEFAALVRHCGVYDLGWHAQFQIAGRDRTRWLNGMVTNNIRDLAPGCGNYNFLLNAQGHIQGDLYVYNRGETFIACTERAQLETILRLLRKYIIMDQVELTEAGDQLTAIGLRGPHAGEVLRQARFEGDLPESAAMVEVDWQGQRLSLTRTARERLPEYELWMPRKHAETGGLWDALVAAGATPAGTDALEMFRVAAGIPRYGVDIRERDLPQETAQMHALHFSKGCYIGQEIVERIRSRGSVHRTLTGLEIEAAVPAPGTRIQLNGKEVGEITSALQAPRLDDDNCISLALGYIRREGAAPGTQVQAGEAPARISALPFAITGIQAEGAQDAEHGRRGDL